MNIGTKNINGVDCEVHANLHGAWSIMPEERKEDGRPQWSVKADSLDAAVGKARTEINKRRAKIDFECILVNGTPARCTGVHGGTGKALLKVDKGYRDETMHLDTYSTVYRAETPREVIEEVREKEAEGLRLRREAETLKNRHIVRLSALIQAQQEAAALAAVDS